MIFHMSVSRQGIHYK